LIIRKNRVKKSHDTVPLNLRKGASSPGATETILTLQSLGFKKYVNTMESLGAPRDVACRAQTWWWVECLDFMTGPACAYIWRAGVEEFKYFHPEIWNNFPLPISACRHRESSQFRGINQLWCLVLIL
jgi:hypothetical protein